MAAAVSFRIASEEWEFEQIHRLNYQTFVEEIPQHRPNQILMGSGTLANDAIAAELSLSGDNGLLLSNGAYGERLIDHARRFGLSFRVLERLWGKPFEPGALEGALDAGPRPRWMWGVHGETSTGILNALDDWKTACASRGVMLCIDPVVADRAFVAVTSVVIPRDRDSVTVGQRLADAGYLLHCRTPPLRQRNWQQGCFMGDHIEPADVADLIGAFRGALQGAAMPAT